MALIHASIILGRSVMRNKLIIVFVNLFVVVSTDLAMAAEGNAIVILKASILQEDKVVQNLCLNRKNTCTYILPMEPFVEVSPGMYQLWSVDFMDDKEKEMASIRFERYEKLGFKANRIYLIGSLQISENSAGSYQMEFDQDISLLKDACKNLSGEARNFPLANAKTGKELGFSCDQFLGDDL